MCPEHQDKTRKIFCSTCEEAICEDCLADKHTGHIRSLLKKEAETRKETLKAKLSKLETEEIELEKFIH